MRVGDEAENAKRTLGKATSVGLATAFGQKKDPDIQVGVRSTFDRSRVSAWLLHSCQCELRLDGPGFFAGGVPYLA